MCIELYVEIIGAAHTQYNQNCQKPFQPIIWQHYLGSILFLCLWLTKLHTVEHDNLSFVPFEQSDVGKGNALSLSEAFTRLSFC